MKKNKKSLVREKPIVTKKSESKIQHINMLIKNIQTGLFTGFLVDFFSRKHSPIFPIYVHYDLKPRPIDEETIELIYDNFMVVEAAEDPIWFIPIAKIVMQNYPSHVVVFIESMPEKNDEWEKVIKLVQEIIARMKILDINIQSVEPKTLLSGSSLSPWKQITDRSFNRKILELWWRGLKNSEIASKVGLSKERVTNILSDLRQEYGEEIVPTKDQLRKINIDLIKW